MMIHIEGSREEVYELLSKFANEPGKNKIEKDETPAQVVKSAQDKPDNSNVLSPKDLKLPKFEYDKGLRKQHGLIFFTELSDGRVVIEYGMAHYYTTKEKVLQIPFPIPKKYFSKENGWSSTIEIAFKKYRQYLAEHPASEADNKTTGYLEKSTQDRIREASELKVKAKKSAEEEKEMSPKTKELQKMAIKMGIQ